MNSDFPLISVVMTTYNHEKYIEETLTSIESQSYPNLEIIVGDDNSSDKTYETLKERQARSKYRMRIFRNEVNLGPCRNFNKGIKLAEGDYISLFAGDDLFLPNRFDNQIRFLLSNPDCQLVYGNGRTLIGSDLYEKIHPENVVELLKSHPHDILIYLQTNPSPLFLQTTLVRKDFLNLCGGFDEDALADDWILNIRFFDELKNKSNFTFIDEDICLYRFHDNNIHQKFRRHSLLKLQVIWKKTPWKRKRLGFSNIFYDIAIHAFLLKKRKVGKAAFALSQLLKYDRQRNMKILPYCNLA